MASRVKINSRFELPRDEPLKNPLLTAIKSGALKDVQTILGPDSQPNLFYQETLDIALKTAFECRKKPVVEILLHSGARAEQCPHFFIDDVIREGEIITTEEVEIIKVLLENSDIEQRRAVLSKVASKGRSDLIDALLTSTVGLNSESLLSSALFKALRHGHTECIEILIRHGGTLSGEWAATAVLQGDTLGTLKLFPQLYKQAFQNVKCVNWILDQVVIHGNIEFLQFMLETETDLINLIKDRDQLLVRTRSVKVLQFLIDHGVVVHDSVTICSHVLDLIRQEKLDMAKKYLVSGVNINSEIFRTLHKGTPLTEARNAATVQYLINKGANVNERVSKSVGGQIISTTAILEALSKKDEVLKVLLENGADPEMTDYKGRSALVIASQTANVESKIEILLKAGAKVNKVSKCGETALLLATKKYDTTRYLKLLLQHGADVNIIISHGNALLDTVKNSKIETVQMLVESGVNTKTLNACNEKGDTPLIMAVMFSTDDESSKLINMLTTAGADVNKRDGKGYTPLMRAAQYNKHLTLKALIDAGADLNANLEQKHSMVSAISILLSAYRHNRKSKLCIDELLNHGAQTCNVNSVAFENLIQRNASWLIPKIIQNGCAPEGKNCKSPFCIALENGRDKVARYLLGNRFLTKSDILFKFQTRSCHPRCEELLTDLTSQPFSLLTMSFVEVSSALGSGSDREKRVRKTGLPPILQTKLLFKTEEVSLIVDEE